MERLAHEVRRELDRFGSGNVLGEVLAAWPAAVGPAVVAHAWPARLARDGTLHVATASSAWAFELAQLEPVVLERLKEELRGGVAPPALRFAVGTVPEPPALQPGTAGAAPMRAPGPEEQERGRALAAGIGDDGLRLLVARAAAASLAAGRSDGPV